MFTEGEITDAFESEMARLEEMDLKQRELEMGELRGECICHDCPTFNKCADEKKELLYCVEGRSLECIKDELGCICPQCPVMSKLELTNMYYCTQASEKELRGS